MRKKKTADVWKREIAAHRIHHRIADFIITKDKREHPAGLRALVKKYNEMIANEEMQDR